MQPQDELALKDQIDEWLDVHNEVFFDMMEEWQNYNVIQKVENTVQEFNCNNCGKCCQFSPDVYASDISDWLDAERYDILCSIFPMIDEEDNISYGIPTKQMLSEKIQEIMEEKSLDKTVKSAYKRIINAIRQLNPDFDKNSDTCIFYNSKIEFHCLIHDIAPFSCQAYPFDNKIFSKTVIPDELTEKYGTTDELESEEPLCPKECFTKGDISLPTDCSEDDIHTVLLDKINYLSSSVLENQLNIDVSTIFAELFSSKIKSPKKDEVTNINERKNDTEKNSQNNTNVVKMSFGPKKSKNQNYSNKSMKKSTKK